MSVDVAIRPGKLGDHAYVTESWLQCDKRSAAGRDEGEGYMRRQKARIRAILASAVLRVGHAPDDEDAILAWACYAHALPGHTEVYYVYVRDGLRRQGLARRLLASPLEAGEPVLCASRPLDRAVALPPGWRYDRSILYAMHPPEQPPARGPA